MDEEGSSGGGGEGEEEEEEGGEVVVAGFWVGGVISEALVDEAGPSVLEAVLGLLAVVPMVLFRVVGACVVSIVAGKRQCILVSFTSHRVALLAGARKLAFLPCLCLLNPRPHPSLTHTLCRLFPRSCLSWWWWDSRPHRACVRHNTQ